MRRALIAAALSAVLAGVMAGPAAGHANLDSSEPGDGALLEAAPSTVRLRFTEPPDPEISSIEVIDSGGASIQEGGTRAVPGDPETLQTALPADLPDGVYTVSWIVVSTVDGHRTGGAFAFGVGVDPGAVSIPPDADVAATSGPSPWGVTGKALLYAGLALLVAAGLLGPWVFGGAVPGGDRTLWIGAAAALAGTVCTVLWEAAVAEVPVATLLGSATGATSIRQAVAVVATCGAVAFATGAPSRVTSTTLGAAASISMLMRAWGGHAGDSAVQVLLQWAHFTAIGLWIGGLALLALRLREIRRSPESSTAALREAGRFSSAAGWALPVVVATGSLRAVDELGGLGRWRRLLEESYGVTLAVKVGLALALIVLGAVNRYRGIPSLERSGRRGTLGAVVRAEVAIAAGLLVLTGVLTSFPPGAAGVAPRTRERSLVVTASDFATTLRVRLSVAPGTVGPNTFRAEITDFDTGEPLALRSVELRFEPLGGEPVGRATLALRPAGGAWEASGPQLALPGPWRITAVLQGEGVAEEIPMELRPDLEQTVVVRRAPGQPDLTTIELAGGVQLQMYLDPQVAGPAQLHVTAFDAQGAEQPLARVALLGQGPGAVPAKLDATRFGPGHFVADVELTAGTWTFDVRARTESGDTLPASFSQTIGDAG